MPLLNVTVKNFKQSNILPEYTTTIDELQAHSGASYTVGVPDSNTLAKSCLITLTPSTASENPTSGAEGYWAFGNLDITIGGINGTSSGNWLTYSPYTSNSPFAYWVTPGMPLQDTEYDPGGGGGAGLNQFNGIYTTAVSVGGNGQYVSMQSTYDYRIGHDFWKYSLQGTYIGENYEPQPGHLPTYYKYWVRSDLQEAYDSAVAAGLSGSDNVTQQANITFDQLESVLNNWSVHVSKIVAVNSMPMHPSGMVNGAYNYIAQQGNKIFIIVVLNEGVTGQNIIDVGGNISIDIDGQPTFVDFDIPVTDNPVWDPEDVGPTSGEGNWFNNSFNGDENNDTTDGNDADDWVDNGGNVDEVVEISFSDSGDEVDGDWGNAGLTANQITTTDEGLDEANNVTSYDSLASSSDDSVNVDYNSQNTDGWGTG